MIRQLCYCAIGILLYSGSASAQVSFDLKYPEDSKFHTNHETKSNQTLTLAGMNIDSKSSTTVLSITTIGKRDTDGNLLIQAKPESLQAEIQLQPGLSLQFDSANPDQKAPIPELEPLLDVLRAAARLPVTVERDKKNQIVSVKLPENEFEKLPDAAKERMNTANLKKQIEKAEGALPADKVKPGDKWEHSSDANIGNGQTMSFRTNYEYAGPIEKDGTKLEKITGKTFEVNYAIEGNPTLQVTKSDLKVVKSDITILFDPKLGAVISSTSKTQVKGPLTLVINNVEFPSTVDLTIEENTSRQK